LNEAAAWHFGLLLVAGVGSGLVGYAAGLASLVSFPTLIALGLTPLSANVTNSVALTGVTVGGLASAASELRTMRTRVVRFGVVGLVGGAAGAVLLLASPPGVFERIVPWLVALGSVVLLLRPWLLRMHANTDEHRPQVAALIGVVSIYAGYFGAASGLLLLATLGAVVKESLSRIYALRTVISGAANLVAAVIFIGTGLVDWRSSIPLSIGSVAGSALGPPFVRRVPEAPLRVGVALAGLGLALKLFLDHH
jgi:uncharacterized membrane protein YfcA